MLVPSGITIGGQIKIYEAWLQYNERVAYKVFAFFTLWHEGIHYADFMEDGVGSDHNYATGRNNTPDNGDVATGLVLNGLTGANLISNIADELNDDSNLQDRIQDSQGNFVSSQWTNQNGNTQWIFGGSDRAAVNMNLSPSDAINAPPGSENYVIQQGYSSSAPELCPAYN